MDELDEDTSDVDEMLDLLSTSSGSRSSTLKKRGWSAIVRALMKDDLPHIKYLINNRGASPNAVNGHENTPLHIAVHLEKMKMIDYLVSLEDTNINAQNIDNETPLLFAVKANNISIVERLIDAKANVNTANVYGETPLHDAAFWDSKLTLLLLKNGAKLDVIDRNGDTPLNIAVKRGCFETVAMLLYYGADATIPCNLNHSPFMSSIIGQQHDKQEQLLEYETDFNRTTADGMSLLFLAVTYDSPFALEIVHRGADIQLYYDGSSLLSAIIEVDDIELFKEVWSRIDYQSLWSEKYPSVLKCAINEAQYEIFNYIIQSEKVKDVVDHLVSERIVYFILKKVRDGFPVEDATRAIFILLTHGLELDDFEMGQVFSVLGDGSLYRFLLYHTDVNFTSLSGDYLLSSILLHVNYTIDDLVDAYLFRRPRPAYGMQLIENLKQIFPHCIHAKLFQFFIQKALEANQEIETEMVEKLTQRIPSLLELSRNQFRVTVCSKYGIDKPSRFYTIVNLMDIPPIIKDIIFFKIPVYQSPSVNNLC